MNTNNFKYFEYKNKLLGDTNADRILRNATAAVQLNYLSHYFRQSLKMSLINCKVELKLKWPKCFILSVLGTESADSNSNNIVSARDNQKLSKFFKTGCERSVY